MLGCFSTNPPEFRAAACLSCGVFLHHFTDECPELLAATHNAAPPGWIRHGGRLVPNPDEWSGDNLTLSAFAALKQYAAPLPDRRAMVAAAQAT